MRRPATHVLLLILALSPQAARGTGFLLVTGDGVPLAWDNTVLSVDDVGPGRGFDPPFVVNLENDKGQLRFNGPNL